MPVIVITGPQGCGKTRNAALLQAHFGCDRILDNDEDPARAADWPDGSLVLVSGDLPCGWVNPCAVHVMTYAEAVRAVKASLDGQVHRESPRTFRSVDWMRTGATSSVSEGHEVGLSFRLKADGADEENVIHLALTTAQANVVALTLREAGQRSTRHSLTSSGSPTVERSVPSEGE